MAIFCSCGTELPDNARFCHNCGKPQRELETHLEPEILPAFDVAAPSPPPISFRNPLAVRVALLCASIGALLNTIPIVSLGCCLWILGAGFLSAFLYSRRTGLALSVGSGARIGWMTGLLTFVFTIVLTTATFALARNAGASIRDALQQQLSKMPAQDAAARQVIEFMTSPVGLAVLLLMYLFTSFLAMTSLAVAGGALGAKVMEKD